MCPASVIQHVLFKEHNKQHEINVQAESVQQNLFPTFKTSSLQLKTISSSNLPHKLFSLQAALSIDILPMILTALLLKYTTPSYYTLWDITMARYVSLVPQSHHSRNLGRLLIPQASQSVKLLHVGKITQQYFGRYVPKHMLTCCVKYK